MNPKISVIIPTYNSWSTLKKCLESIIKQSLKPFEIIVIDNASTDGTSLKVREIFPKVKLTVLKTNSGVTGGRNYGLNVANPKSQYYLFFDHDMVADSRMLENLLKTVRVNSKYGIVTPKIFYLKDRKKVWAAGTNIDLITGQVLFRGGEDTGQFDTLTEVQVAPAAMLVKKDVIDKIKGFDERYFATYEDTDFCFRAKEYGFKTIYTPKSIAFHDLSSQKSDDRKRLLSRSFWVGRNRILFMGDFSKNFYLFLLISPVYILYFFILAVNEGDYRGFINYLNGYLRGLISEIALKRIFKLPKGFKITDLRYYLPWTYPALIKEHLPKGSTVLDVGCGDGKLMSWINFQGEYIVTGLDINPDELNIAVSRLTLDGKLPIYKEVKKANLSKPLPITKKYDLVVCSQVVEHFKKVDALKLINRMEKVSRNKVIVATINGFFEFNTHRVGKYDKHLSGWSATDFQSLGYFVYGSGLRVIYKPGALRDQLPKFLQPVLFLVSYLLSPLVKVFIPAALFLIAVKELKDD